MKNSIDKHIFICVTDVNGRRYTIEIPPQFESMHVLKDTIHQIQMSKEFVSGRMHHDDVCNMFIINGLVAKVKRDFQIMYLNPAIQKALDQKTKDEALDIIQETIMEYYKIPPEKEKQWGRNRNIMAYKEMFCYITLTRYPLATQEEVAKRIGYKTHVTAWHHKKKIEDWLRNEYQTIMDDVSNIDTKLSVKLLGISKEVKDDFILKTLED